ncbi:MAG: UvrD-helicase domain-containing protein [Bryobacteraceae bacterium]|nr:UvrD-helicase domain-containing protein [Bryobacteraceae bacterium]
MDFLEGLNPPQRQAVAHAEGPLLILAGAGSGKTRVITHRICHLMHAHAVPGYAILAVTFTNKAAGEMRDRVGAMLARAGLYDTPLLSTFHSFCVRLLRRDGASLADLRPGFTPRFLIYDEDDQTAVMKAVYRDAGLNDDFMPCRAALSAISRAKNRGETPEDFYKQTGDPNSARLGHVFERYEGALRQANAVDFDDLLLLAVRLLRHDSRVRELYAHRLHHLLVDEYQDTNRSQYDLMRLLAGVHRNVCAVGDEDQSIYSWRGADIKNILDFERDYPDAATIRLEQNYRSTKTILKAAGAVVANNLRRKGKTLWTNAAQGEKVGLYQAHDAENEALFIADTIERLLQRDASDRIAILYRTNWQSRQIEEALRRYSRKYIVVGGLSFYQRAEIKDILAYLKLLLNPHDPVSFHRVVNKPARGLGRTTVEQIEAHAREQGLSLWAAAGSLLEQRLLSGRAAAALSGFRSLIERLSAAKEPVDELLRRAIDESGYRQMLAASADSQDASRLENLEELVNAASDAAERGEGPAEFLDHAALVADADALDEKAQVSLLTLHNAKGLEWPIVFMAGLEDGLFPHSRSRDSEEALEEERRLCYVGMTRAQKVLVLSWARSRRRFGGGPYEEQMPSRFLKEVPREHLQIVGRRETAPEVELVVERHEVRESVRRNTYTGKTYNSLENISQFFQERGLPVPPSKPMPPLRPPPKAAAPQPQPKRLKGKYRPGATVEHPRYGKGLVLRREGEGDDEKLTISFPGYGLKKLVAKFAGLKLEE